MFTVLSFGIPFLHTALCFLENYYNGPYKNYCYYYYYYYYGCNKYLQMLHFGAPSLYHFVEKRPTDIVTDDQIALGLRPTDSVAVVVGMVVADSQIALGLLPMDLVAPVVGIIEVGIQLALGMGKDFSCRVIGQPAVALVDTLVVQQVGLLVT